MYGSGGFVSIFVETKQMIMARLFTRDEESVWWDQLRSRPGKSFFHLYTKPPENGIIISDGESLNLAISYMAIAAEEASVDILAYAVMSNHFHWLIRGNEADIPGFFNRFRRLMDVYLTRHGKGISIRSLSADMKGITSLKQFRDEVSYILRNPYIVRSDIHIMINPWTSAFLYFNPTVPLLQSTAAGRLTKTERRRLLKSSHLRLPAECSILDGKINPASFVDYRTVEALFGTARKYSLWLLKNVEAQIEVALRYGENVNLPDEELAPLIWKYCKESILEATAHARSSPNRSTPC